MYHNLKAQFLLSRVYKYNINLIFKRQRSNHWLITSNKFRFFILLKKMRIIRYTVNFIELPVDLINNSRVLSKELRRYTSPLLLIPDDHSYTIEIAFAHSSYIRLQRKMTGVFFAVVDSFEIQRARRLSFFKLPCARTRICFFDLLSSRTIVCISSTKLCCMIYF